MSVLEKIVQAEKEASALLLESRQKANVIVANAHDELDVLKTNKAKEVSSKASVFAEQSNKEMAMISQKIALEKEKVISAISESSGTRKQKIVSEIFKDLTAL